LPEYRKLNFYRLRDKYAAQHSFLKNTQYPFFQKGCGERISQTGKHKIAVVYIPMLYLMQD
jgi:hypothetical protein